MAGAFPKSNIRPRANGGFDWFVYHVDGFTIYQAGVAANRATAEREVSLSEINRVLEYLALRERQESGAAEV